MSIGLLPATSGHDVTMQMRGVVDGAIFVLQSALSLAAAVATILALAPVSSNRTWPKAVVFATVAVASGWLPQRVPAAVVAPAVLLLFGALIAMNLRLRDGFSWTAIVVGAMAAGVAGGFQTATIAESIGGAALLFVLVAAGLLAMRKVRAPEPMVCGLALARRMAGAWIAAVGVLLVALWMRRGG